MIAQIYKFREQGFTLVEIAIVMLIVTLLLSGLLPMVSGQVEQRHVTDTRKQMDEVQQALIGFAIINGRLPCPADVTTPTGQVNAANVPAGTEYKTNGANFTCANVVNNTAWGVIPWATLGMNETDAWGRRFTYRVTSSFADSTDGTGCAGNVTTGVSFQLCSSGNLTILSIVGGTNIANGIPAVIISHGTNGLGAYTPSGQQIQPVPAATTDEGDNIDPDNNFVSHDFVQNGFDDIVVWISPNTLMNRMVAAGKLP